MFNWLGKLMGTEKATNTMIEGVRDGLDALVYTDEEKATDARVERSEARMMVVRWMEATSGQNLARRLIALVVTGIWVFQYFASMALNISTVWVSNPEMATKLMESAKIVGETASQMNGAMMLILGFYFAAPHLGKISEAAINKFQGKPT